jgi:preprotein translocase subunit YajC
LEFSHPFFLCSCALPYPAVQYAEMFTFALILPLLFLPCIYLWFLRRATAEAEAFAQLQDRLQEEEALLSNGGVTAAEILDSLENVKLVSRTRTDAAGESDRQVWLLPSSAPDASIGMNSDVKECCICMSDFAVQDEADLEGGLHVEGKENNCEDSTAKDPVDSTSTPAVTGADFVIKGGIVRTRCGHVFHKGVCH